MQGNKKKREMVPVYSAAEFFSGKKGARPVGRMSNPDEIGPVLVDRETLFRLMVERRPVRFHPSGASSAKARRKRMNSTSRCGTALCPREYGMGQA